MYIDVNYPKDRDGFYRLLREQTQIYSGAETDMLAALSNFSAVLKIAFSKANWAGFYLIRGDELVLGPFQGRPAVTRIPFGAGVCGTAWREDRSQVVEDVDCFSGHIACDCSTHSEIVIPLRGRDGRMWGVLDMDSVEMGYFTQEDRAGLEECVKSLGRFAV